jgi:hypothetical protein
VHRLTVFEGDTLPAETGGFAGATPPPAIRSDFPSMEVK